MELKIIRSTHGLFYQVTKNQVISDVDGTELSHIHLKWIPGISLFKCFPDKPWVAGFGSSWSRTQNVKDLNAKEVETFALYSATAE